MGLLDAIFGQKKRHRPVGTEPCRLCAQCARYGVSGICMEWVPPGPNKRRSDGYVCPRCGAWTKTDNYEY